MWGKMLCALFLPQERRDCCQKCESCWSSGPLGRRYNTYSLGRGSSKNGSSTWEKSLQRQTRRAKVMSGRKEEEDIQQGAVLLQQHTDTSIQCWGVRLVGVMFTTTRVSVCMNNCERVKSVCCSHQSQAACTFFPPVETRAFKLQREREMEIKAQSQNQ